MNKTENGISYYIVSKPLQYFNATNIENKRKKVLLLIDGFFDSERFYNEIKKNSFWDEVYFFTGCSQNRTKHFRRRDRSNAYRFLRSNINNDDYLYIDSDRDLRNYLWLSKINTNNIYVYEEGVGSYRNDLSTKGKLRILKKILYMILGIKHHFGGSKFVKGLYIYDIEKHKQLVGNFKNERLSFKSEFATNLNLVSSHFDFQLKEIELFLKICQNERVVLYLTTWNFDEAIYNKLYDKNEFVKLLKLHPHIREKVNYPNFDYVLSNGLFVELFIIKVLEVCQELVIYHHNSSALQYIDHSKMIAVSLS